MPKDQAEILIASGTDSGFREVLTFIHFVLDLGKKYGRDI